MDMTAAPALLRTDADLRAGLDALVACDPRWQSLLAVSGPPPLRRRPEGFAGLAAIVTGQQLSIASAAAIWGRLAAAFDPFEPAALRRARADRLARLGLSAAKIRTIKAIARAIDEGTLDLAGLARVPADEAHRMLTAVHGIGPWTADLYLLFCLGHADAWPAGDLALQEAIRLGFAHETRPDAKTMVTLAQPWRPWRGVAAHVLWAYYRAVKRRDFVPVAPVR